MIDRGQWLTDLQGAATDKTVDGLVLVSNFRPGDCPSEVVVVMEKAKAYGAHAVFFEAGRNGRPSVAQAFVFVDTDDAQFAELHRRLWSWGGVPLLYRKTRGLVQLFRCAHKPDFMTKTGERVCNPIKFFTIGAVINDDPWWDASRLRNGTLWDDPAVCKEMLSADKAAHKHLVDQVKALNAELNEKGVLPKHLRRKLLILSLLIAYLEKRGVFPDDFFGQFVKGASEFFQVLADGNALIKLLGALEERFNGHVFTLSDADRESLRNNGQLARFAGFVEGRKETSGQYTLWQLYSFKDLPVEVISHIYQLFVEDKDSSVYTPPFLVRLMLDESLSADRLDRLEEKGEIILDPSCGSGIFLVEAYKRLVLHWRSRNGWKKPREPVLKRLLAKVHGIDIEPGAIELAAFSLCLALCDALEPEAIRSSYKLFPLLTGETLHCSCFFAAKQKGLVREPIGVIVGNPPFKSTLTTTGAKDSYARYQKEHGQLPDKQLAYLFLHEAMGMLAEGGVLSMLQNSNFLYNRQSLDFRRNFITRWDVREILDFVSVRGLFQKGGADTKVVLIVAETASAPHERKILHATFRRSGRVNSEQGFDIDYYDLHWVPHQLAVSNDSVWRTNLLGGLRVLAFIDRIRTFRTLGEYAATQGWNYGEGFIEGQKNISRPADHITGKPLLPSEALTLNGIDESVITKASHNTIQCPRSKEQFSPPMLLVREQMDIPHALWTKGYLTYKDQIVGFAASNSQAKLLSRVNDWMTTEAVTLRAIVAVTSAKLFVQRATTLTAADIFAIPYPANGTLELSPNERIIADDIVTYYRDLIRLGEDSVAMKESGHAAISDFTDVFARQINAIYKKNPLKALESQSWPGVICQPFVFGKGKVDWSGADELQDKLAGLLREQESPSLNVTRIARIYDGSFIFLLKPDRLRYWLRSIALRDADETLADLRAQGF